MVATRTTSNSGVMTGAVYATDVKEEIEWLNAISHNPLTLSGGTTANAIVGTCSIPIIAYSLGMRVSWTASADNTGAVTINGGGGVSNLMNGYGVALVAGEIKSGARIVAEYLGANFRVLSGLVAATASILSAAHYVYQTAQNVLGANAVANVRTKYSLNAKPVNGITGTDLNTTTSVITLAAGFYVWRAHVGYYDDDGCQLFLRNVTDGVDFSGVRAGSGSRSGIASGAFTIAAVKTAELQYYVNGTGSFGFAVQNQAGISEQYGFLELIKVG